MLSGKNIYKSYGPVKVLRGVDIEIKKGEVVSIAGPSGSGKSTLLHILGTLDQPDEGSIVANGVKMEYQPKVDLVPAAWWKRALNYILDGGLMGLLALLLLKLFPIFPELRDLVFSERITKYYSWEVGLFSVGLLLVYYFLMEGLMGRTVAKFITGTKLISEQGTKPAIVDCLIRTVSRLIPFDFISFLSNRPIGWHDSLSGTIVVNNSVTYIKKLENSLSPRQLAAFRNKHIGFVFQFHHLLPEFTALENVCIPGWLAGRRKKEVEDRAKSLLAMLGLSHRLSNKPNQLSGGEQQRVAVARALINAPDIVMADEPTGNLDSANAQELHQLFFDLRKKFNQTFLIVTHNEELALLSDRVLHMKDGKIV